MYLSIKAREVAELLSRLSKHLGNKAAMSFVREVASTQIKALKTSEETDSEKQGNRFRRRDLADIFTKVRRGNTWKHQGGATRDA